MYAGRYVHGELHFHYRSRFREWIFFVLLVSENQAVHKWCPGPQKIRTVELDGKVIKLQIVRL